MLGLSREGAQCARKDPEVLNGAPRQDVTEMDFVLASDPVAGTVSTPGADEPLAGKGS